MIRTATIYLGRHHDTITREVLDHARRLDAGEGYQGEYFDFDTPEALFRVLNSKRWAVLNVLQNQGPLGVRALARALDRGVRRVHDDVKILRQAGFIETGENSKLTVPFAEIRAELVLRQNRAA